MNSVGEPLVYRCDVISILNGAFEGCSPKIKPNYIKSELKQKLRL